MRLELASPARLTRLFRPRSVALVGATDNSRWSLNTYENLKQFGFLGPVYLIHPRNAVVHGARAYRSLADLPKRPDLIYVMVPTGAVAEVLEEAGRLGIGQAVVLTAGFSEMGPAGARLEAAILEVGLRYNMCVLGPNGNGFINAKDNIVPYGLLVMPPLRSGPVGIVLQSGALASTALAFARDHAIGISLLVSMGNEMMVSATDVMEYLIDDPATRVIALFLESIRDAKAFRRAAERAFRAGKPLVALKVGKSPVSQRTALAHTGALVGNDLVNAAAFRQLGVIRVDSLEDLLLTAGFMGTHPPLPGRRMGVITPSGGASDLIADRADEEGLQLPDFSPRVGERLRAILPPFATVHNPLDVTGYVVVDPGLTLRALGAVIDDPEFDFLLTFATLPPARSSAPERYQATMAALGELKAKADKPVLVATQTLSDISDAAADMAAASGIHVLGGIEHGLGVIGRAVWWSEQRRRALDAADMRPAPYQAPLPQDPAGTWGEWTSRQLLAQAGIPVAPAVLARSPHEARVMAERLGGPVVLKVASDDVLHKSDMGGVALNLPVSEVEAMAEEILIRTRRAVPSARLDGVLVQPMREGGQELLVSVSRDPAWGLVLTVALGGIWVEIFQDRALRVLPVTPAEIRAMVEELRGSRALKGGRGQPAANLERVAKVVSSVAELALGLGDRLDLLEINPLWIRGSEVEVLDALMVWRDPAQEEAQ
ncbi:acetate--CoA ligase family protein [Sulfobacillus harzensis]|uniref:acetate--CoA ligase family protein n=1 Tax=Sulfobacillus harzensis TaxID=2729629 RepID=UPI001A9BA164